MINKYPYTDFHELNLDWFLKQFKQLKSDWTALAADNAEFKATMTQKFDTLDHTVQTFTTFVTDYFDNLDVQQEINNKLNDMVSDGTLATLLTPFVDTLIPSTVTAWLDANVDPVGSAVMVDKSLSIAGNAADAAITGDFRTGFNALGDVTAWGPPMTKGYYLRGTDGKSMASSAYAHTSNLWAGAGTRTAVILDSTTYQMYVSYYGPNGDYTVSNGDYIGYSGWGSNIWYVDHAVKFGITFRRLDQGTITDSDVLAFQNSLYVLTFADKALTGDGHAADARETGFWVRGLNRQLHDYWQYFNVWDQGTIGSSGENLTSVKNCRTARFLNRGVYSFVDVVVPAGFELAAKVYDDNAVFQYTVTYVTGVLHIPFYDNGTTFRLVIRKTDGTNLAPSGVPNNGVCIKLKVDVDDLDAYISDNSTELVSVAADVYDMYNDLATAYPDYVTRTAKTSGGTTLYEYTFTTGDYNDNSGQRGRNPVIKKPVCLLTSGVHGYERSAVMSLYTFCRSLCERDYRLADVINGVTFKVIPVVCPWGYTNDSRINANSVNINRNFASSTWVQTSPGQNYSGAAPGDQDETKIVQAWMSDNASDATVYIDWHNSLYTDEISCLLGLYDADALKWKKQYLLAINRIIPFWYNTRRISTSDIPSYTGGGIAPDSATGSAASYARDLNILAFTLETSWNISNTGKHSNFTIGTGAEAFANMIRGFKPFWDEI